MRKLIAGMKVSLDEKIEGPDGYAAGVDAWADDYGVTPQADACLLGGGMYPGYERYWSAVQNSPDQPLPMTGKMPTPDEVKYARFTAETPHYVLSSTLTSGKTLFGVTDHRRGLELRNVQQLQGGRVSLTYGIA